MPVFDPRASHEAAVVDIGSNSVRLVIYRIEGRAIWTLYNEKVVAGLGRGIDLTGTLPTEGKAAAMLALRRFKAVLDWVRPATKLVVATAAIRNARDGQEFVREIQHETDLRVRVVSGEEEGRYSALGVIAGDPGAQGVMGDLGGSSLELVRLDAGRPGDGVTLPLGPFSLGAPRPFDPARVRAAIGQVLAPLVPRFRTREFHAVGGVWRAMALIHMDLHDHPLQIIQQHEMTPAEALKVCRALAKPSPGSLGGVARKRAEALPYAAAVLEALIERLGLERIVVSAYGLREGLLFDTMPPQVRALDPLIEGCAALGARKGLAEGLGWSAVGPVDTSTGLGAALAQWLKPVFRTFTPEFPGGREAVLTEAACRLADFGARLHPDHRADLAFAEVLRSPVAGQTHVERAFLAVAIHARYGGPPNPPDRKLVDRLLTPERQARARALGLALRLGADLSGRVPDLLRESDLSISGGKLVLSARPAWIDMLLGEQTEKRARSLATALGLELEMRR
jgi:exopolyphosphatase/guanosine-5'-triphosphate,3'-diphosphate pyrophosphatase